MLALAGECDLALEAVRLTHRTLPGVVLKRVPGTGIYPTGPARIAPKPDAAFFARH